MTTLQYWSKGIRFYIAVVSIVFSLVAWAWAVAVFGTSATRNIRLQEIFAWTSLLYLFAALSIGPLTKIFASLPGKKLLFEARRLIGIGAAWFAGLHIGIAYASQFKFANPLSLPTNYQRAFALGILALVILLALTVTSFDAAFRQMGKWWFRLHRLVYVALLLVLLHAFMIGVHAINWPFLITLTIVMAIGLSMHVYLGFVRPKQPTVLQIFTISIGLLLSLAVLTYGYTAKLGYNPIEGKSHGHIR